MPLSFLRDINPQLYTILTSAPPIQSLTWGHACTNNEPLSMRPVYYQGKHIHSRNPIRESKQVLHAALHDMHKNNYMCPNPTLSSICVIGLIAACMIYHECSTLHRIIIIEPNPAYARNIIQANTTLCKQILTDTRTNMLIISPLELYNFICTHHIPFIHGSLSLLYFASHHVLYSQLTHYCTSVQHAITTILSDYQTQAHFARRWTKNIIHNVHYYYHQSNTISYLELLQKKSAAHNYTHLFICGAGPSLDKQISLLKASYNTALIIASDTALMPLLAYNIVPHIVLSIDPQQQSSMHYPPQLPNCLYMFNITSAPSILQRLVQTKQHICFFSPQHPLMHMLHSITHTSPLSWNSAGNVGHTCFTFARNFFSHIPHLMLCGLDFSYPSGTIYAKNSAYIHNIRNKHTRIHAINNHLTQFYLPILGCKYETNTLHTQGVYYTPLLTQYETALQHELTLLRPSAHTAKIQTVTWLRMHDTQQYHIYSPEPALYCKPIYTKETFPNAMRTLYHAIAHYIPHDLSYEHSHTALDSLYISYALALYVHKYYKRDTTSLKISQLATDYLHEAKQYLLHDISLYNNLL